MKRRTFRYKMASEGSDHVLRESAVSAPPPVEINVRAAKDRLSSLLEQASRGHEIIITSDGQPKAKLGPVEMKRKRFKVDWELLRSMPLRPGPTAEQLIREERDGRD